MNRLFVVATFLVLALSACVQQQPPPEAADPDRVNLQAQAAGELFFSEYVEGSSNNKALEIFNGTGGPVDLTAGEYSVVHYSNGSDEPGLVLDLEGTVAAGDVFVLAHASAAPAVIAQADQMSGAGLFNGNDALVLLEGDHVVDSIGQIGLDPGSQWGSGLTSTQDNTLRRKASVCGGDTNPDDAFDPSVEWIGFARDTFDGLGSHTATCGASVVINEIRIDQPSSDDDEYFELAGSPGESLDGMTYLVIGDGEGGSGVIEAVVPLDGHVVPASGFLVVAETSFTLGSADVTTNLNFENGDNVTHLLVSGFTGTNGDDLDANDDGDLDVTPWDSTLDQVALLEEAGTPTGTEHAYGSVTVGPDGSYVPGHVYRCDDGWRIGTFGGGDDTPGSENPCDAGSEIGVCGGAATLIHDIQGDGSASPLDGTIVVIEGIVTGDFQRGDGDAFELDLGGFFMQEELADEDGNPLTSEGIFVFDGDAPAVDVSVDDTVRVLGTVDEFNGLTELTSVAEVVVCAPGTSPVTPVDLTLPLTSAELERWEGMLVRFTQDLVISEYFNFDRFGEIVLSLPLEGLDRPFQPTSYAEPGSGEAEDIADAIVERRILIDDGRTTQNPDPAIHPNGSVFDLDNRFRGGDVVTNATGALSYGFGAYRLQPTTGAEHTSANPRTADHASVGGELEVAAFNVLNYFTTLNRRGADTPEEFARQKAKIVAALAAIDADVVGLIEIENNTTAIQDLVSGLNDVMGSGTYDFIDTGAIGTDEIKVAFIYQPASVTPTGSYAVLDSDAFVDPNDLGSPKNRPALAQTFEQDSDGALFTAVVNHLKSKGSECGAGDDDPQQGNCNLTRTLAAQELLDWIGTDPTGSGDSDFVILGDLNAYDEEDPIQVLVDADYTDLGEAFEGEFAYTYVFDGQFGHLDYAMASSSLTAQVTGATNWHINADEPDILDYDTTFKEPAQAALYEPNPYRSSDHDPVIVGLDLSAPPVCSGAKPSRTALWPPRHFMVDIAIEGVTDPEGDDFVIEIDGIFQDEPVDVAGDSDGNTSPDGAGIGTDTAEVRAERIEGGNGRVYHIAFTATDEYGAACSGSVQVDVPSNQGRNGAAVDDGALYDSTRAP